MGCSEIPSDCVNFATSPVSGRLCTCAMTLSWTSRSELVSLLSPSPSPHSQTTRETCGGRSPEVEATRGRGD